MFRQRNCIDFDYLYLVPCSHDQSTIRCVSSDRPAEIINKKKHILKSMAIREKNLFQARDVNERRLFAQRKILLLRTNKEKKIKPMNNRKFLVRSHL